MNTVTRNKHQWENIHFVFAYPKIVIVIFLQTGRQEAQPKFSPWQLNFQGLYNTEGVMLKCILLYLEGKVTCQNKKMETNFANYEAGTIMLRCRERAERMRGGGVQVCPACYWRGVTVHGQRALTLCRSHCVTFVFRWQWALPVTNLLQLCFYCLWSLQHSRLFCVCK